MEKHILHWSYWLGFASLIIAALWRAANAFGLGLSKSQHVELQRNRIDGASPLILCHCI
jgi:hypothetical protein